jgi:hypothetical protein
MSGFLVIVAGLAALTFAAAPASRRARREAARTSGRYLPKLYSAVRVLM